MNLKLLPVVFFLVLCLLLCGRASASCVGINCSCSINAGDIAFGTYNPVNSSNVDVTGTISVTCGALVLGAAISYEIRLSTGSSGNAFLRSLSNGGETLAYNLYTTPSRTTIWGDGTSGTGIVANAYSLTILLSRTDNFSVYGRLPPGQHATAGTYSDSITATVVF